jgi:mannosyltransferase OCH1-like enzyme
MSALLHTNNTNNTIDNYKDIRKRIIPLDVYLTWGTKNLPNKMNERVETLKKQNPQFKYHLFDDNDCREFIKTHFREDVLYAYDHLIPGAYKADLWRYCVLFIKGGIYLDIKLACVNDFKLISLTNKEHFVKDRPANSVYNAFMCCRKGNILLFMAIRQIVANVKSRYYGKTALSPTGPEMLGSIILKYKIPVNIDMTHYHGGGYVLYKKRFVISTEYKEYNDERNVLYRKNDTKRYDKLWASRNIYK